MVTTIPWTVTGASNLRVTDAITNYTGGTCIQGDTAPRAGIANVTEVDYIGTCNPLHSPLRLQTQGDKLPTLQLIKTRNDGRFYVELISQQALDRHMKHQDLSNAMLARKIGRSKATIGHLRSGGRTTTSSETAKRIEKALGLPMCTLFLPKVEPATRSAIRRFAA